MKYANYRRILKSGVPRSHGQFIRIALVPCNVLVLLTGPLGRCFGFSPTNKKLLSLILEICELLLYFQTGSPVIARSVRMSYTVPYDVLVPLPRPFGGCFGFSPTNAMFYLSPYIFKLSWYSQIGSPMIVLSVYTSYIGPVRGVGSTHGAVRGLFRVFPH